MSTWRFSDGTIATLGGNVEGASLFAQQLRAALADEPQVGIWPVPFEPVELDVNDPALLNRWLLDRMSTPVHREQRLKLIESPKDIPALPPEPVDDDEDGPAIEVH
jgi:hypothetical protein